MGGHGRFVEGVLFHAVFMGPGLWRIKSARLSMRPGLA
jgi:hypothetical protein